MKKRFLSILLTLCMLLSIVPMTPIVATAASSPSGVELKMVEGTLKYGSNNVDTTGTAGLEVYFDHNPLVEGYTTVHGYVLNGGTYYLGEDVTIDKPLIIKGTEDNPTTLNLNGHVLKYENATQKSSVIVVADSAYFTLTDSNPDNAHTYTVGTDTGLYVLDDTNQSVHATLTGGVITGGTGTDINGYDVFGGGVFVGSTATFEMTGGNIVGCAVASTGEGGYAHGGGVFVAAGQNYTGNQQNNVYTKFTMTGGSIVGCTAEGGYAYGGGVYVREYADFTMNNNARIANCTATCGGGVYNKGTFTMVGSTIENCTAKSGGGVNVAGSIATFTMTDGTITGCTATYTGGGNEFAKGGGVCLEYGKFNMVGGTIENCTATGSSAQGGGVCVSTSGTFTMTGGTIKSCSVGGTGAKGDGMYIENIMKPQGGSVYGAVIVENNSTLENTSADGGTIFYGSSKFSYGESAALKICGCRVEFKTGSEDADLYAQTLVGVKSTQDGGNTLYPHNENAKISQPEDPTTPEGKHVVWSFTKADGSTVGMWDFSKSFEANDPECVDDDRHIGDSDTLFWQKVTLTAVWHDLRKMDVKAATCTETGISAECWYCETCNKYFMDNKGTEVATDVTTAIDSNNHAGTLGEWQKDENSHWKTYSCCTTVKGAEGTHNFGMNDKCECGAVQYTVTFDPNGGTVDPTSATTDVEGKMTSLPIPERNGCRFTGWYTDKTGGTEVTKTTVFIAHTTIYAHWNDYTAPTGEIKLGKNSWNTFLNNITFGLFFKETQEVTITATDNSGELVTIEYLLSDKELTAEELATATFTAYSDKFNVEPNNEYVIYAKLSDKTGNVTYINSNGIVLDNVAPVISGITNGKTYCEAQTVIVSDKYEVTVTVNGTPVTLDANGQFTLSPAIGTQSVVATDKAGNVSVEMIVTVNDGHEGGTATCTKKAVCKHCGLEYGEVNNNNHDLEHNKENAATVTTTGNKEYWHCKDCDNNFSDKDGKNVIDLKDTVISKLAPEIIDGKGQSLTAGETRELTFRSNAAYSDFICVEVDGKTVDENNYTVKEGSTIVTLKADYVATLSVGEHTLGIVSESGTATTTFTVNAKVVDTNSPQTGDNSHMALWFALLFVSGGALIGTVAYGKKKKYSVK